MSSLIERLPPELLDLTLHFVYTVPYNEDENYQKDLQNFAALCSTSKTLRAAAMPFLYANFDCSKYYRRVRCFLRTLCSRPELTKLVGSLRLHSPKDKPPTAPTSLDLRLFKDALRSSIQDETVFREIEYGLDAGCHRAETLLLLSLSTQIQSFGFDIHPLDDESREGYHEACTHCPNMLDCVKYLTSTSNAPAYPKLFAIHINADPQSPFGDETTYPALFSFMATPKLQSLSTNDLVSFGSQPPIYPESSSSISRLSMESCFLNTQTIKAILKSCKAISSARFELGGSSWPLANPTLVQPLVFDVDPLEIGAALTKHSETLRHLILHNRWNGGALFYGKPAIGPLTRLRNLQELGIDEYVLRGGLGWNQMDLNTMLPQSLRLLTIHTNGDFDQLGEIMKSTSAFCSPLQDLVITFPLIPHLDNGRHLDTWPDLENDPAVIPGFSVEEGYEWECIVVRYNFPEMRDLVKAYGKEIQDQGLSFILDAARNPEKYKKDDSAVTEAEAVEV